MDNIIILLDSARGVYIPQHFATECATDLWNVSAKDVEILKAGPYKDLDQYWDYWDAWFNILNHAYYIDPEGFRWTLHHDGDLFALCEDLLSEEEYNLLFGV